MREDSRTSMKPSKLHSRGDRSFAVRRGSANIQPARFLAISFAAAIAIGTLLLSLPVASVHDEPIAFIDALFTATSAVCVTGLTVLDTGSTWSSFGQAVIGVLVQIGGLGVMTMSTLVVLALGRRVTLQERLIIKEAFAEGSIAGMVRLVRRVAVYTLVFEAFGALVLAWRWFDEFGFPYAIWLGVFHSVSAFNNAGFDLLAGDSLVSYVHDPVINLVIPMLIIFGGLGIVVLRDVRGLLSRSHPRHRLSLHSKVVLTTTFGLVALGFFVICALEWNNPATVGNEHWSTKLLAAWFHSAASRTSGFNTLPVSELHEGTLALLMMLMFVGASPGSTGGGIKTTTFAAIIAAVWATIQGKEDIEMFGRRLSHTVVFRAMTIAAMALSCIVLFTTLLVVVEQQPFFRLLFEEVSAFATTGMSVGAAAEMTPLGKSILIVSMYIGRLGPLTLAFAMVQRGLSKSRIRLPEDKLPVG